MSFNFQYIYIYMLFYTKFYKICDLEYNVISKFARKNH